MGWQHHRGDLDWMISCHLGISWRAWVFEWGVERRYAEVGSRPDEVYLWEPEVE